MSNDMQIKTTLQDVLKSTQLGDGGTAIGSTFYGINHRNLLSPVPVNKDNFGLTLFTRPALNLSTQNTRSVRDLIPFLTNTPDSIQRMIRCYLDPRLNYVNKDFSCPFVDHQSAFIPLLTNHLLTLSGFPDPSLDTYTSKQGGYKEQFSFVDGVNKHYEAYDLTATFRNMIGDPLGKMFSLWSIYESSVFQGIMTPYPDFLIFNEIDYQTRIYRLILDVTRRFVIKIGCAPVCFPTTTNEGGSFNFESDRPINSTNDQFAVNFRVMGACYNDPILVYEFNQIVSTFNPNMENGIYASTMKKVPADSLQLFNYRGYPRIDPDSMELEWYVFQEDYIRIMTAFNRHRIAIGM